MFRGLTLRGVIITGLIIAATALLCIAVCIQDHFLAFIALVICIALVGALFRTKRNDGIDEQTRL